MGDSISEQMGKILVLKSLEKLSSIFNEVSDFLDQNKILDDIFHYIDHYVIETMYFGKLNNKSSLSCFI